MADVAIAAQTDSPEARRYNRLRRWLSVADFAVGLVFLVVLLVTRWSDGLRDLAYRWGAQNYSVSLFVYLLLLLVISKVLSIGLDYYGFSLERSFKLSNQKFGAWAWDEVKGFLVGLALFMGLFVLLAQLAPVVLFPIFYKFEPLENEDLRRRLVMLSEHAGTRV